MSQRRGRHFTADELLFQICRVNHAWYGGLCNYGRERTTCAPLLCRCQKEKLSHKNVSGATTGERNSTVGGGEL